LTPFVITEEVTVYLSGAKHLRDKEQAEMPHAGVYLADSWNEGSVWTNDGSVTKKKTEIPSLYVSWPDYGVVGEEALAIIVEWTQRVSRLPGTPRPRT